MVPLAVIVVLAVIAVLALAASGALAVKLHAQRRQSIQASQTTSDDDLEKYGDAPTRRVQIQRGRIVSWHSTAAKSVKQFARIPTPKIFSSRPSSTLSLPRTIDLENEIAQFRRDYALAKEKEAAEPGRGEVNGLMPISRLEEPRAATVRPPVLSAITESEDPADLLKESSWETYNGHRQTNHPLSSELEPLSPSLEKAIDAPDYVTARVQRPPAAKANSSTVLQPSQLLTPDSMKPMKPGMPRSQTDARLTTLAAPPKPLQLRLDTVNLDSILKEVAPITDNSAEVKSPAALSIQSAIYKSPVHEIVPAAPQPRKPSKLDLRGSFSKMDYGFPSPPLPSSAISSPTRASMITLSTGKATFGGEGEATPVATEPERHSTMSDQLRYGDFMDLESVTTRTGSRASSRATSRYSRYSRSRSSTHRVRKRPPPLDIEAIPPLPGQHAGSADKCSGADKSANDDDEPLNTGAYLASPTASDADAVSIKSATSRKSRRKSLRASIASTYSALSPTFDATPVFRVPLYTGNGAAGPKVTTIATKKAAAAALAADAPGELERRGSDGDVVLKSKRRVQEQAKPSILRSQSHAVPSSHASPQQQQQPTEGGLQTILRAAHGLAGSTQPATPQATSPAPTAPAVADVATTAASTTQSNKSRNPAHLQVRPILKTQRAASHNVAASSNGSDVSTSTMQTATKTSARPPVALGRSVSATVVPSSAGSGNRGTRDHKALPPLPSPSTPPGAQRIPVQFLRVADIDSDAVSPRTTTVPGHQDNETFKSSATSTTRPAAPKQRRSGLDRIAGAVLQAPGVSKGSIGASKGATLAALSTKGTPQQISPSMPVIAPLKVTKLAKVANASLTRDYGPPLLPELDVTPAKTTAAKLVLAPTVTVTSRELSMSGSSRSNSAASDAIALGNGAVTTVRSGNGSDVSLVGQNGIGGVEGERAWGDTSPAVSVVSASASLWRAHSHTGTPDGVIAGSVGRRGAGQGLGRVRLNRVWDEVSVSPLSTDFPTGVKA